MLVFGEVFAALVFFLISFSVVAVFTEEDEDLWSDEEFLNELEDIPPVKELNNAALKDLETFSLEFGLFPGDFTDALNLDQSMQDKMDRAKALDYEKQRMSGKKSRRERRILKDTRLKVMH